MAALKGQSTSDEAPKRTPRQKQQRQINEKKALQEESDYESGTDEDEDSSGSVTDTSTDSDA